MLLLAVLVFLYLKVNGMLGLLVLLKMILKVFLVKKLEVKLKYNLLVDVS